MNVEQVKEIIAEANAAASAAAAEELAKRDISDWDACGFGWVNIYSYNGKNLDGRSKIAKVLKAAGLRQDYTRAFNVWNPGNYHGQSISIKEVAASAYAKVLTQHGFTAYAGSKLD
jgi:hypothetical protein